MSVEKLIYPIECNSFGGLWNSVQDQTKVPHGRSPNCQNVIFYPGGRVATREGLTAEATIASQKVLSINEYIDNEQNRYTLILVDDGTVRVEPGNYTYTTVASNIAQVGAMAAQRMSSTALFNRMWCAFGASSIQGSGPMRVFYQDPGSGSAFFDPVAIEAPGVAPTVATSATAGNVSVGVHLFRVFFKTRTGYWTSLSPQFSLTVVTAGKSVDVSNIPIGPSNVVGRVIVATPATSNTFFFLDSTQMVIPDNTTTAVTFDFTDANLINGTQVTHPTLPASDLLRQTTINPNGAVAHYSGRLAFWGFRHGYVKNSDVGFYGLRFQSGWNAAGVPKTPGGGAGTTPNGWTQLVAGWTNPGGANTNGDPATLTGSGAQAAVYENSGIWQQIIPAGVEVWARIRLKKGATWAATESIHLYPATTGSAAGTITPNVHADFTGADFSNTTEYQVVSKRMMTAAFNKGWLPTTRLRFSTGNGTVGVIPASGHSLIIDYIEIYTPGYDGDNLVSRLSWSKVNNPEAVDGLYGPMLVEPENGEPVTACFEMKGAFYMCKDKSMFVTQDDGVSEPVNWQIGRVSTAVGTPSRWGVGMGDGWAAIASRNGLYFFNGSAPTIRLSDEIVPTWQRINFSNTGVGGAFPGPAQKIWCVVDTDNKRIYVGVPLDGNAEVSHVLVCSYVKAGGYGNGISYGADPSMQDARDWTIWTVQAFCATFSIRSGGQRQLLFGDSSGHVGLVDKTATSDYGAPINSIYRVAFESPAKGRNLLGRLAMNVSGNGTLSLTTIGTDTVTTKTWNGFPGNTLAANPNKYSEWKIQHQAENLAFEISTNAVGSFFALDYAIMMMGDSPTAAFREHGA